MKYIFTSLIALSMFSLSAQKAQLSLKNSAQSPHKTAAFEYTLAVDNVTYNEFTGGSDITNGLVWDDPDTVLEIGFSFPILGEVFDSLDLGTGTGAILVGLNRNLSAIDFKTLLPFGPDLMDRGYDFNTALSPITVRTTGTAGNRVFEMQWKNAGFYGEIDGLGTNEDYVNFQMRLYEANGVIQYHFGEASVTSPNASYEALPGPPVGVLAIDSALTGFTRVHLLDGPPANPSLNDTVSILFGTIPNGTRYTFTPINFGIDEVPLTTIKVYPNPATNRLFIDGVDDGQAYQVVDITGRQVLQGVLKQQGIDISKLKQGFYFIKVGEDSNQGVFRFQKTH